MGVHQRFLKMGLQSLRSFHINPRVFLVKCSSPWRSGTLLGYLKHPVNKHQYSQQHNSSEHLKASEGNPDLHPPPHPKILGRLGRIENRLRYHGYSTLRIGLGVVLVSGVGIYLFREFIRENVADEVSTVATRSLGDENVKLKAQEMAMALLNAVLNDPTVHAQSVLFLQEVLRQPGTQQAAIDLVSYVLSDPHAQQKISSTMKSVIVSLLDDEDFRKYLTQNLKIIFEDENVLAGAQYLLKHAFESDATKEVASVFFQQVLATETVKNEASKLAKGVVNDVVSDGHIQQKTGDAMWSAFTHSVKPKWFRKETPLSPSHIPEEEWPDTENPNDDDDDTEHQHSHSDSFTDFSMDDEHDEETFPKEHHDEQSNTFSDKEKKGNISTSTHITSDNKTEPNDHTAKEQSQAITIDQIQLEADTDTSPAISGEQVAAIGDIGNYGKVPDSSTGSMTTILQLPQPWVRTGVASTVGNRTSLQSQNDGHVAKLEDMISKAEIQFPHLKEPSSVASLLGMHKVELKVPELKHSSISEKQSELNFRNADGHIDKETNIDHLVK